MTAKAVCIQGWSLDRILGSGGFGIVELWVHTSGKKHAIKICKRDITQLTEVQQKRWIHEVRIMKRLKHPNIIKGLELPFKHPDDKIDLPLLCMEFCRKGDLRKVLNNIENCCGVSEEVAVTVMKDISSAVEYLHSNNITHRDLKPENIVLQDENNIVSYKLIDLGYAKELGEASTSGSLVGTLNYVAPELLWKQTYSCSVDYWSLGILFYELITGIRPFLPRMQHTMTWMQYIKNKGYNDIRAFKSEGKIIFGQDIPNPTNLSWCLRKKLVEWFRVVLQWDPKRRGKQFDDNGRCKLVVFKLLYFILSNKIVYVFCASTYKLNAYEVGSITKIIDLQYMIEKDNNIPVNQQTLTDYFGKILTDNKIPLLLQIQDPILFVFKNECPLLSSTPTIDIPPEVQKMLELSGNQMDHETLEDYYRVTIFFIKEEMHLFQLYIFALTIKVDFLITKVNTFNENMTNVLTNVHTLLNELLALQTKSEKGSISNEQMLAIKINFEKVTNLLKATSQIKSKFNPLMQESNKLKEIVQSIDHIKDMSDLYNNAQKIYELHKEEHSHRGRKPTEMVKLVFEFLKTQEAQFRVRNIPEIVNQLMTLQAKLSTLEIIFDSVTAMREIYRQELLNMIQYISNGMPQLTTLNKNFTNTTKTTSETTKSLPNATRMEIPKEFDSNQLTRSCVIKGKDDVDMDNDVIYDNLLLRYTLDNLLTEMQRKLMDLLSLETGIVTGL